MRQDDGAPGHPRLGAGRIAAGFLDAAKRGLEVLHRNLQVHGAKDERRNLTQLFDAGSKHLGSFFLVTSRGERVGDLLDDVRVE